MSDPQAFDANVLVYAANELSPFHVPCLRLLEETRSTPSSGLITWNVCYEFLRLSTHPNVLPSPWEPWYACKFITELLNSPGFEVLRPTEEHATVLARTLDELPWVRSNRFFDLHTAILMRENGVREICTLDNGFRAFPFLTVIDPRQ